MNNTTSYAQQKRSSKRIIKAVISLLLTLDSVTPLFYDSDIKEAINILKERL